MCNGDLDEVAGATDAIACSYNHPLETSPTHSLSLTCPRITFPVWKLGTKLVPTVFFLGDPSD